jgi:hypothetical protein
MAFVVGPNERPARQSRRDTHSSWGEDTGKIKVMRRFSTLLVALTLAAGAGFALAQTPASKAAAKPPAPSAAAQKITYPPIPNPGFAAGRPVDQARAVYQFAAEHPEVLKYVPCYCGCESTGHPHNESCFVKRRDAKGNVLEWDTHGYG